MSYSEVNTEKNDALFLDEELWLINVLFRETTVGLNIFSEGESNYFSSFALRNGIGPVLYRSKYVDCLSTRSKLELKKDYLFNLGKNTAFQLVADEVANILKKYEIPVILLKGCFLASHIYSDVAFRPMGDIDILVPSGSAVKVWKLLNPEAKGLKFHDEKTGHHLPPFILRGCLIEVHRYLFPLNARYSIPVEKIWETAVKVQGKNVLSIAPGYQVIYLLLHIYYSYRRGGLRLGWFYDIKVLLGHYGNAISLEEVKLQANELAVWEPVNLMLMFFTLLIPDNRLRVEITKKYKDEIEEMVQMLQTSDNQKFEFSYGVAWERLWYTKGFLNKIRFLKSVLLIEKNGKKRFSIYRLIYLTRNTFKLIKRKFFLTVNKRNDKFNYH